MHRASAAFALIGVLLIAQGAAAQARAVQHPAAGKRAAEPAKFSRLRSQAEEARAAGRVSEAIALYTQALALEPSWTEGYWHLGTIYYDADRHRECRDAFVHVLREEPEHGAAWGFRGLCEFKLNEYDAALEHLSRANQLGVGDDPDFVAVLAYHRAILLARAREFERAFDVHAGLVRGGNTSPEIRDALGLAMLRLPLLPSEVPAEKREMVELAGRAGLFSLGMMKEAAEQALEQLVSKYSDAPNVHYLYGSYLARERPAEALEQFKIELARSPGHVLARVQIAQELITQSQFEAAAPFATEAARLAPNNFMARKVLGQVKLQAGDAAGAIAELEAARTLEPSSPSVRFHLARAYQRGGRAADAARERTEFRRLETVQQRQRGAASGAPEELREEQPPDGKPR